MLRRIASQIFHINARKHNSHNKSKQILSLCKYHNKLLSTSSAATLLHNQSRSDSHTSGNALFDRLREDASKANLVELTFQELVKFSHASQLVTSSHKNIDETYLIESAEYIRKQLTILLARIIIDFQNLPYGVADNKRIEQIMQTYCDSYTAIKQTTVLKSILDKKQFDETIQTHLSSWTQVSVVPALCLGLLEMAQEKALSQIEECPYLTNFIDRIVVRRLAARILLGHYVALHENRFGIFEENCDIIEHIETAKNDAVMVANKVYNDTVLLPKIVIYDQRKNMNNSFVFSGKMLHQFVFELLKNSIRATMEYHSGNSSKNDIKIIVVNSIDGDITIKIADNGGGISRNEMNKIWLYSYTQSRYKNNKEKERSTKNQMEILAKAQIDKYAVTHNPYYIGAILHENVPMYGLGYGLPLIKAYSQYFGGQCNVHSIEGFGTDAYLFMPTLATSHSNVLAVS